jgi:Uma2 family endonuclease
LFAGGYDEGMSSAQPSVRVTPEQYLEIDRASEYKNEYYDGWIVPMAGGTASHALITTNTSGELRECSKGTKCRPYSSDLRVRVSNGTYCYPDVPVMCGEAKLGDDQLDTLLNPILLVEVLSPSTVFRREEDGTWRLTEFAGLDAVCHFKSLGCSIPLAEIYRNVTFQAEPELPQ